MADPRPADPSIIERQAVLEAFRLAPDGETVVYVKRAVHGRTYRSHLWSVSYRGGRPRQLTRGAVRDTAPEISPDGRRAAFLRASAAEQADESDGQIWILPLDGGEAWQLASVPHGVSELAWSPDGRQLAFTAPDEVLRWVVGELRRGVEPTARRITRLDFRDDEVGMRDRSTHLFTIAVREGARRRQLTRGDFDVSQPTWSPDGSRICFVADRNPDRDLYPRTTICEVSSGGQVRELAAVAGDAERPSWSPDGTQIAFVGIDAEDPPDHVQPVAYVASASPSRRASGSTPTPLTADLDLPVGNAAWTDLVLAEDRPGPIWTDDATLLVNLSRRGRNVPYRVSLDGEAPEPLVDEDRLVGAGIAHAAGRMVISAGIDGRAAELYAVENRRLRRLTRDGSAWQRSIRLPALEELQIDGSGGPIQVWLASPPAAGRRRLPLIVHFHGGPTGAWAPGSLDSILLTGAGYRVAMPNIRGSTTLGAEWIGALDGRWGDVDDADALAVVDGLMERGLVDERRIGILGLSYGGFLVQWLIGRTDRFAAAVAENGVANQVSTWANSYFGVHYNRRAKLGDPLSPEGIDQLWRTSPLANVAKIQTPLLMLQSAADAVCPPADNEQLFTALRTLGREVEYVLYPEEHHEMKNYGRPDRRIDRSRRILDWFERHFRVAAGRSPSGG
jgi:dipeptidyl aminopeptidase/acylaminoacyl peptidase